MKKRFFEALFLLAAVTPAHAITFATGAGADSASCGAVASPCRTVQQAVTNTPAGGYVVLQGPADFGRATVNKSLSTVGEAGATLSGAGAADGEGVIIIEGGANDVIRLRGLTIKDAPLGGAGVLSVGAKRIEISDCVFRQTLGSGVQTMHLNGGELIITDTAISAPWGIFAGAQSQPIRSYFQNLRVSASEVGILTGQGMAPLDTVIRDSSLSGAATGLRSLNGDLAARNVSVSNSGVALSAITNGSIYLSRSTVTGNAKLLDAQGGFGGFFPFGDNAIRGNANETLIRTLPGVYR